MMIGIGTPSIHNRIARMSMSPGCRGSVQRNPKKDRTAKITTTSPIR